MAVVTPHDAASTSDGHAPRQPWIDNIRVAVIVGVIGAHVSLIYALDVGWYYEERTASTAFKAILAGIFSPGLLFGMGLLFFVAGMFTPAAFEHKGPRQFLAERAWRLGVPTVAYVVLVNPAMNALGGWAQGERESVGDYFRRTYRDDVELGVAWFLAALLVFSLVYAGWRSRHPASGDATPLRQRDLLVAAAVIAVASFIVRLEWPFLGTGALWGLNVWEYPQMATLFALGALAHERHWLDDALSMPLRRACARAGFVGAGLAVLLGVGITITDDADPFLGGLRPEAALLPVIEATLTLGLSLWAVDWFHRRWNRSRRFQAGLGRASFGAYLLHAPITVVLAVAARDVPVPAELKLLAVFALSVVAAFGLARIAFRSRQDAAPRRRRRSTLRAGTFGPATAAKRGVH